MGLLNGLQAMLKIIRLNYINVIYINISILCKLSDGVFVVYIRYNK